MEYEFKLFRGWSMVYTIMTSSKVQAPPICLHDILLCLRITLNCHSMEFYVEHYTITTWLVVTMSTSKYRKSYRVENTTGFLFCNYKCYDPSLNPNLIFSFLVLYVVCFAQKQYPLCAICLMTLIMLIHHNFNCQFY